MKNAVLVVSLILLFGFAFGFQKAEVPAKGPGLNVEADVAAIKALIADWVRLHNAEDFDNLMSVFYTENPVVMEPNVPAHRGKEEILFMYRKDAQLNIQHVETSVAEEVRVSGNLAVAWGNDKGTTTPRSGGAPAKYDLKWLMAFELQPDGTWKCLYEIWNDNLAAPARS